MKNKNTGIVVVIVVVLFGVYRLLPRQHGSHASEAAPDFSIPDLSGQTQTLSAYRGKVVLLNFWATWCTPCQKEIPEFVDLQKKYQGQGFQIIGISMDDEPDPVRPFYQQMKMNYPVVMGTSKLGEQYGGILGLPVSYLVGTDGHIRIKHIGPVDASVLEKEIQSALHAG